MATEANLHDPLVLVHRASYSYFEDHVKRIDASGRVIGPFWSVHTLFNEAVHHPAAVIVPCKDRICMLQDGRVRLFAMDGTPIPFDPRAPISFHSNDWRDYRIHPEDVWRVNGVYRTNSPVYSAVLWHDVVFLALTNGIIQKWNVKDGLFMLKWTVPKDLLSSDYQQFRLAIHASGGPSVLFALCSFPVPSSRDSKTRLLAFDAMDGSLLLDTHLLNEVCDMDVMAHGELCIGERRRLRFYEFVTL